MAGRWLTFGIGVLLAGSASLPAQAQSVADFYRGKTIQLLIGVGVGGEYDLQARLVARHIGKHIPGNPNVVPQNMVGAGGINMANHLFNTLARDGTAIGMMGNNFPATQAVGGKSVRFDAGRFQWLGSIAPVVETMAVWHRSGVKTIDDLRKRETVAGASGRGAITFFYPTMMNEFLGTKFKIVTGYPGGNQINLAMERGEVQGVCGIGWTGIEVLYPEWFAKGTIKPLVQLSVKGHRDLHARKVPTARIRPQRRRAERDGTDLQPGRVRPALRAATRRTRGSRCRAAQGLHGHVRRPAAARRSQENELRYRADVRRGHAGAGRTAIRDAGERGREGQAGVDRQASAVIVSMPTFRGEG